MPAPKHASDRPYPERPESEVAARAWLAIAIASVIGFALLSLALLERVAIPFDGALLRRTVADGAGLRSLWDLISALGDYPMIPIAIGLVLWLLWQRRRREALLVAVLLIGVTVAQEGVKALVGRVRPLGSAPGIPGVVYSYPSGHAFEDVAILGIIAMRLWRSFRAAWLRVGFAILVAVEGVLIGVARVALDLHYPSDILGGYFGAFAALGFYAWLTRPGAWADKPATSTDEPPHEPEVSAASGAAAGSRVDAGTKTRSGPLGRIDPPRPAPAGTVPRPPPAPFSAVVVAGFIGLIAILGVVGSIAEGIREQEVFAMDAWATPFLHGIASPGLDAVMTGITTMGSIYVVLPVYLVATAALIIRRRYGAAGFLSVASGGALLIDFVMKLIFERPRPKLDYAAVLPDYSFPSGHSMNGVVFYVGLALIAWSIFGRRVGVAAVALAAVLALAIGTSRIYLGYHYFTDVVGGWLTGVAWLLIVVAAFRVRPNVWPWRSARAAEQARVAEQARAPEPPRGTGRDRGSAAS